MALSVNQANTVSHEVYGKHFVENVYDASPFLKMLKDKHKVKVKGGNYITFPVEYKELGTAQSRDWNDEVVFESVDTWTTAILQWAHIDAHTMITKEERFKNYAGPQQVVDVIKAKEKQLSNDLTEQLSDQIFATSSASNKIIPIAVIIDSSDAYAGIAPADASIWAGNEDTSSTAMTRALLYSERGAAIFGMDGPTVHFTTQLLLDTYNKLLGADERYHNTREANAGFKTITLYGDNVYADHHIAAGHWYGLDMKQFELHVMEEMDMTPTDWQDLLVGGYPKALAKYVDVALNLVCYRRRTNFKLTALTGSTA